MKKNLVVGYGIVCYLLFTIVFFYAIGFIANTIVLKSIDSGLIGSGWQAAIIDLGLLGLFAVQHSGMARQVYKRWEEKLLLPASQRSTYVLFASLTMLLLFWQWRPLPAVIWNFDIPWMRWPLWIGYILGWGMVFTAPFMTSHKRLYGLEQVWSYRRGRETPPLGFLTNGFYRYIRHPMQLGLLLAFWSTPHMTVGHLLFALASSGYILIGTRLEERDLLREFGVVYRKYQEQVPRLIPFPKHGIGTPKIGYSATRMDETKLEE